MVGARITKRAEDSLKQSCLIRSVRELEFDRIDRYCVLPGKVTLTVDEATRRDTVSVDIALEAPCRDEFRFAGQDDINEALRSHCPVPRAFRYGPVRAT